MRPFIFSQGGNLLSVPYPRILLLATLALTLVGCGGPADPDSPEGKRQAVFKQFLHHSEPMGGMLGERLPFDGESFAAHAEGLVELVEAPWQYFPEPGDSKQRNAALPQIWSDPAEWQRAIDQYRNAVTDLVAITRQGVETPEQVAESMAAVQQGCRSCHEGFRR